MKPALTPDEWDEVLHPNKHMGYPDEPEMPERIAQGIEWRAESHAAGGRRYHAAAALALYGQPFGFTHEDVDALRLIHVSRPEMQQRLESLATRIAAFLPPEEVAGVPEQTGPGEEPS